MNETSEPRRSRLTFGSGFLMVLAVGTAVRVGMMLLPQPYITDVSYYDVQAVAHLLHGVDPYGASYAVPPSLATPGAANVFAYLPGVFAFIAPAGAVWTPVLGMVVSDLVVAVALYSLRPRGALLESAAYLLFPPVILFSTYFLNDALPGIAFLAAAIALDLRGRGWWGAALWGLALATSVEGWLVFPFYAARCIRRREFARFGASLLVAAAWVAPFFAWDPHSFIEDTVYFQFQRSAVPFLSAGPFGSSVNASLQGILASAGVSAPLAIRGALVLATLAVLLWRYDGTISGLALRGAAFSAAALFLLAGDLFWSYLELPFVLALAWLALKDRARGFNA